MSVRSRNGYARSCLCASVSEPSAPFVRFSARRSCENLLNVLSSLRSDQSPASPTSVHCD